MIVRTLSVLLLLYIVVGVVQAGTSNHPFPNHCLLLESLGQKRVQITKNDLNQFTSNLVSIDQVLNPGVHTTVLVTDQKSQKWVVKLSESYSDLRRDQFAHKFVQDSQIIESSEPYLVEGDDVKRFLNFYLSERPNDYLLAKAALNDRTVMSIAPYYQRASIGHEVLAKRYAYIGLLGVPLKKRNGPYRNLFQRAKQDLYEFVLSRHPELKEVQVKYLMDRIISESNKVKQDLYTESVEVFLLQELKSLLDQLGLGEQISDFWVINQALGIPDPHNGNWMLRDDGKLLAIDLAWPNEVVSNVDMSDFNEPEMAFLKSRSPFGGRNVSKLERDFLIKNISPKMAGYLASLDVDKVMKVAKEAGYDMSLIEAQNIVSRAHFIVAKRI